MRSSAFRISILGAIVAISVTLSAGNAFTQNLPELPDGSRIDLSKPCPVCGMKIVQEAGASAAIVFKNGTVVAFDASSDFFKYALDPQKYAYSASDIKSIFIKEYNSNKFLNARDSYYVVLIDTSTDMGPEIRAFSDKAHADQQSAQIAGSRVLRYGEVSLSDLQPKKKMLKMKRPSGDETKDSAPHSGH